MNIAVNLPEMGDEGLTALVEEYKSVGLEIVQVLMPVSSALMLDTDMEDLLVEDAIEAFGEAIRVAIRSYRKANA